MAKMKAVQAAVLVMEKEGVTQAFGVPGAAINPMYSALRQRGSIPVAQIYALPGNRVNAVRRIADQRHPMIGDPCRVVEAERIGGARRDLLDLAKETAHRGFRLRREISVAE